MSKAKLTIVHPSANGKGSSMLVDFHYFTDHNPPYLQLTLADQESAFGFNYDDGIIVDLRFNDISQLLYVLSGKTEEIKAEELGDSVMFAVKHSPDKGGYIFAAMQQKEGEEEPTKRMIVLKEHEAFGLRAALEGGMFYHAFIKAVNV